MNVKALKIFKRATYLEYCYLQNRCLYWRKVVKHKSKFVINYFKHKGTPIVTEMELPVLPPWVWGGSTQKVSVFLLCVLGWIAQAWQQAALCQAQTPGWCADEITKYQWHEHD